MVKRKSNSKSKGNSYKGIPAKEHARVAVLVEAHRDRGRLRSPQQVWRELQEDWNKQAEEKAAKERQGIEEWRVRVVDGARDAFNRGLNNLARVRDVLTAIELNHEGASYFDAQDLARLARCAMVESCREIEQALCNLGFVKPGKYAGRFGVETDELKSHMPKEPRQEVLNG